MTDEWRLPTADCDIITPPMALNLAEAAPGMYDMVCLPLRMTGADGAPARVVLKR